jgi:glycosyltransferase involved in cell wall biosynthesis
MVVQQEPRATFVFLRGRGTADYEAELHRQLEEAHCGDHVRFVNEFLSDHQMAAALNLADAYLSVPRTDLLSLSVLEGMACGCLPIVADLPAYRTRLTDTENAVVIPQPVTADSVAEACLAVAGHPQWIPRFAERNVARVQREDNWSLNARKMEDVYHWAIENPLSRREAR